MKQTTEMKATTLGMEIKINLKNKTVTVSEATDRYADRSSDLYPRQPITVDAAKLLEIPKIGNFGITGTELQAIIRTQPSDGWDRR